MEPLSDAVREVAPARPQRHRLLRGLAWGVGALGLMALGAVGSPRVLDPLERLALHSKVKADRLEAAAAVLRITQRSPGPRSKKALEFLATSEDVEVKALLPPKPA